MKFYLSCLAYFLAISVSFGQFDSPQIINKSYRILKLVVTDLNGDGNLDVVAIARNANFAQEVIWYENYLEQDWHRAEVLYTSPPNTFEFSAIDVVDFDNNGLPDILLLGGTSSYLLEGQSDGSFNPSFLSITNSSNQDNPRMFEDYDNDGDIDILIKTGFLLKLFRYVGAPNYFQEQSFGSVFGNTDAALLDDINADGITDALWIKDGVLSTAYGTGTDFAEAQIINENLSEEINTLQRDDANGDNLIDIVTIGDDELGYLQATNESGSFAEYETLVVTDDMSRAGFTDVNGDGLQDIVSIESSFSNHSFEIFVNEGDAIFTEMIDAEIDFDSYFIFELADFDGDQKDELLLLSEDSYNSSTQTKLIAYDLPASADDTIEFTYLQVNNGDGRLTFADVNFDGQEDMIMVFEGKIMYAENLDGNGRYGTYKTLYESENNIYRLKEINDFDNDGNLELLVADFNDHYLLTLFSDGTFSDLGEPIITEPYSTKVYFCDYDMDGDQDLIAHFYLGFILVSNINGTYSAEELVFVGNSSTWGADMYMVDFDQDGDLDIINSRVGDVYYFENLGTGFSEGTILLAEVVDTFDDISNTTVLDFDNDGDFDIIFLTDMSIGSMDSHIIYCENTGTITEPDFGSTDVHGMGGDDNYMLVDDFDFDGLPDVFAADNENLYMLANNNGNLGDLLIVWTADYTFGYGVPKLQMAQIDNQLGNDLVVSNAFYDTSILWFGNPNASLTLSGKVFYDENENEVYDNGEYLFPNQKVLLEPNFGYRWSDNSGAYAYVVQPNTYQLSCEVPEGWSASGSDFFDIEITQADVERNFGLFPDTLFVAGEADIYSAPTRCGFEVPFWVNFTNMGTLAGTATVSFSFDETTSYISSNVSPATIEDNTLTWIQEDFNPGQSESIEVILQMPGVDLIGTYLNFSTELELISLDETDTFNLSTSYRSELNCAYDPNDKQVRPARSEQAELEENYTLFEEELEYIVRFQNTGTDTAFTVVIRDPISEHLDLTTLRPLAASHPYQITTEESTAVFTFDNILLVDSLTNEPASHGFVSFAVTPLPGLSESTLVENTAGIYFDFNPPIITNTVQNIFVSQLPVSALADFSYQESGLSVTFLDLSQNIPTSWNWTFGEGSESILQHPTHVYAQPGTYEVCLMASNSTGSTEECKMLQIIIDGTTNNADDKLTIVPNPTSGLTEVIMPYESGIQPVVRLLDSKGASVSVPLSFASGKIIFDAENLAAGTYFFELSLGKESWVGKFLVL